MNLKNRGLITVVVFLLVIFAGDRLGGYLLSRLFQATKFRFAQVYQGDIPADIVFLGNSRGVHMFHRPPLEAISGQTVVNLSFNGMPAEMMPVILGDYLRHHDPPTTLFLEVSCVGRTNEPGSLERFKVLSSVSPSFRQTLAQRNPTERYCTEISHLYRFNSELMWRSLFFGRRSDQDWIMESIIDDDWELTCDLDARRSFEASARDADSIRRVIAIAKDHGIEFKLILAPYFPEYARRLDSMPSWLEWLSEELDTTIADYSLAIEDHASFADPIHLNWHGAKQLAQRMVERGDL